MALPIYLAMTAWEMEHRDLPPHCGWMACHFSPYSQGLSNIPEELPENALLIINDRISPCGHDPQRIADQLQEAVQRLSPIAVLLDFQRPYNEETVRIIQALPSFDCPLGVTEMYAKDNSHAVFLPPIPLNKPLQQSLSPWTGREIWLEISGTSLTMTVTESGCQFSEDTLDLVEPIFSDPQLHCHYSISTQEKQVTFLLQRTREDIQALLQEAESMGVSFAAGLYQELFPVLFVQDPS